MKKIFYLLMLVFSSHLLHAQLFVANRSYISIGTGIPSLLVTVINNEYDKNAKVISYTPPLFFHYEYSLNNHWSAAADIAVEHLIYQYTDSFYDPAFQGNIYFMSEGNLINYNALLGIGYHPFNNANIDPYVRGGLGIRNSVFKGEAPDYKMNLFENPTVNLLCIEFVIGARYYFNPWLGIYAEFGVSKSPIKGGLVISLNNTSNN